MRSWVACVLCVFAFAGCKSSAKQEKPPEPPAVTKPAEKSAAEQVFTDWLAAFNGGDLAALQAFRDKYPMAKDAPAFPPLDTELPFREQTGGFVLVKAEESTATTYSAIVKERGSDQHARAVVEVEAAPPHLLKRLDLRAIPTPDGLGPQRMNEAEALQALRAEIDKRVAADEFSGAVAIAKDGKVVFSEAYGFADREKKIANTVDTRFRIGSMNKMFTSVALLELVQAGKVKLDAPINTYLNDYPNKDLAAKVTPHHLLSHTGGTGDIFGPDFDKKRLELRTHADYVKLYGSRALEFAPGEKWAYSNYGMLLAGYLVEKVTGKSYYDAVAANVYAPAGMTSTASPPEDKHEAGRVVPYSRENKKSRWKAVPETLPYRGTAAGGGDSTVTDLISFANALTSHKLIDAKHLELATTRKMTDGPEYGYGFQSETEHGVRCFGHGGGAPGMNGRLFICDSGYTIAVLSNFDPPAADKIASFVVARLPAK